MEILEDALKNKSDDNKKSFLKTSRDDGAEANLFMTENLSNLKNVRLHCQFIRINNLKFLTFPGEIFYSLVKELKRKHAITIIGYTNDYNFYLTDKEAFNNKFYEANSSPFKKSEGKRFIEIIENNYLEYKCT